GGPANLPQRWKVEGVRHLGPVQRDRRTRWVLCVDDRLEAELGWVARRGMGRLGQFRSQKCTRNAIPISAASLPVAANSAVRVAALNASMSGKRHSARYANAGSPIGLPNTGPWTNSPPGTA